MEHSVASLLIYLAVGLLAVIAVRWIRAKRGSPIDPNSSAWQHATSRAQSTMHLLEQLWSERPQGIWVKFPLLNKQGDREHVWGELESIGAESLTAKLATPLLRGGPTAGTTCTVARADLEDWQAELQDGRIRGGFTTQAELALAKQSGRPIPAHIKAMEGRFVDA